MMGTKDFLVNVDFLALAMIQSVRTDLFQGETQLECMSVFMQSEILEKAEPIFEGSLHIF